MKLFNTIKFYFILILLVFINRKGFSQVQYSGVIDEQVFTMVLYKVDGNKIKGYAVNESNFKVSILESEINGEYLMLTEENKDRTTTNLFKLKTVDVGTPMLKGMAYLKSKETVDFQLKMDFNLKDKVVGEVYELIQPQFSEGQYFKTVLKQSVDDNYLRVQGIKVFDKQNQALIQTIDLDCDFRFLDQLDIGDYNFDGISDLSIFEASYVGPNSSYVYVLKNLESDTYEKSQIQGISLEFDPITKTIKERNQCCAGSIVSIATYKLVDSKMKLIKEECFVWNEETEELEERPVKDCN